MKKRVLAMLLAAALLLGAFSPSARAEVRKYLEPGSGRVRVYPYVQQSPRAVEYGFCDASGSRLTDPNYELVMRLPLGDSFVFAMEALDESGEPVWQYASSDGSVVSELCFTELRSIGGRYLLCMRGEGAFELLDAGLQICATELDFESRAGRLIPWDSREGLFICYNDVGMVLVDETMKPLSLGAAWIEFDPFGDTILMDNMGYVSVRTAEGTPYRVGEDSVFLSFARISEEMALVTLPDGTNRLADAAGNVLWPETEQVYIGWNGGYQLVSGTQTRVLSRSGQLLLEGEGDDYAGWQDLGFGSWFSRTEEGITRLRCFETGEEVTIPAETYHECLWAGDDDARAVCSWFLSEDTLWLFMPDVRLYEMDPASVNFLTDPITGEAYFITPGEGDAHILRSADYSTELLSFEGWYELGDGVFTVVKEDSCTLYFMDGCVLFTHEFGLKG